MADKKSPDITATQLKARFQAGKVPLQSDFANLIDIADIGRKAVGQAPGQTNIGAGFKLSNDGLLELDVTAGNYDLQHASALKFNEQNKKLAVTLGEGLEESEPGITVKASTGITVNANGVSVDTAAIIAQILPPGIIVMWSGSEDDIPPGWALCNGEQHEDGDKISVTPDLRDRFIVGAGDYYSGYGEGKNEVSPTTVTGTVTVQDHILILDEIPEHEHMYSYPQFSSRGYDGDQWSEYYPTNQWFPHPTESAGGGKGHNHGAELYTDEHTHSITIEPPYYALAFIIKL